MKRNKLLPALDVSLLLIIMLLIGLFSIRYDESKGIGKEDFVPVQVIIPKEGGLKPTDLNITVIAIENKSIKITKIRSGRTTKSTVISSVEQLQLDQRETHVIYGYRKSEKFLSEIVIKLVTQNISFWIASE